MSHSFSHCPPSASSKWSAMLVLVAVHSPLSDVAVESRGVANSLLTESESISGIAKRLKISLGILIQGRNLNTLKVLRFHFLIDLNPDSESQTS